MTNLYALVSPEDAVIRVQPDTEIDPSVQTKPGWRWLPLVEEIGDTPGDTIEAGRVLRRHPDPDLIVPAFVSPRQIRLVLRARNLLAAVETAVQAAGDDAVIAWEYSVRVERQHPLLVSIAASAGLSEADLDSIFLAAGKL